MESYTKAYKDLNPAQRHAVDTIEGPVLVVAGPGTGKTQLLSVRVASILKKTDVNPQNILCLTFTEAAARNMRERLTSLIGEAAYHVGIHTFHSFGSDIIQKYPEYFEDRPLLAPIDELGSFELLHQVFRDLPHSNPLSLRVGEDFLHLPSARSAISWLKQAGIQPKELRSMLASNQEFISYAEPHIEEVFSEPPSSKQLPKYESLLSVIREFTGSSADTSLAELCAMELSEAIAATDPSGRYAKPITGWRNRWLKQSSLKKWTLADKRRNRMFQALAGVYESYQKLLSSKGYYTFDDMIMRTIQALETHEELRLTLQEQYLYILVDEYQDTNGAQNRLLELIADSPLHEGRPNILVVGDDDQAIYRFQGAHASIMVDFVKRWRDVEQIVLTDNYRSGQRLLDLSRYIIMQGQDRLENRLPNLSKVLKSASSHTVKPVILRPEAPTEYEQYSYVAKEINTLIKNGTPAKDIAVLAPKHSYLQMLVPHLLNSGIHVSYDRREHILEQPHIAELLDFAQLVAAAGQGNWQAADALLPKVLAAPYWGIPARELWQLSLNAYKTRTLWLEQMHDHAKTRFKSLALAIISLAKQSLSEPMEHVLDQLIGSTPVALDAGTNWTSPYKQYYFSDERLEKTPDTYLKLLGQLTTLRRNLREYRPETRLTLQDLMDYVSLYRRTKLTLLDTSPHVSSEDSVQLMTAYGAKGLEWDTVFVLGCHNDVWGTKVRGNTYSLSTPTNLSWIKPARDSDDDRLRLFYVALTRAKHRLYLTCFITSQTGKPTEVVSWLAGNSDHVPEVSQLPAANMDELVQGHLLQWETYESDMGSLRDNLQKVLSTYRLSPTHLNDFLDITKGGPRNFFMRHILHFPEALSPSAVYGSAVHQTLHSCHVGVIKNGVLPDLDRVTEIFKQQLEKGHLSDRDQSMLLERGTKNLQLYLKDNAKNFEPTDKSELDFSREGVILNEMHLTGKVDLIKSHKDKTYSVLDYKTGAPMTSWKPTSAYPQIRAHLYSLQLLFYKQLVCNSSSFGAQTKIKNLRVQFVEPTEDGEFISLDLAYDTGDEKRTIHLLEIIWQHIMDLDFPDTSSYSLDLKGVIAFEEDLLNGTI